MTFTTELARFGPGRPMTLKPALARAYCRHLACGHYENFSVASLLLPRRLVPHFHHVYAFCRWADDLADEAGGGQRALQLLGWWRGELQACYAGRPRHPVFVALRETVVQFALPMEPFARLIDAFERDQTQTRYATFDDLLSYCRCSADPVGRIVLHLIGAATPENERLSDAICSGLQLANFWQDVARDWAIGRVYLPAEDMARFGVTENDLAAKRFTPAFAAMMQFEVTRTRELFAAGAPLIGRVPGAMRGQIDLFRRGGVAILNAIERAGGNVLVTRPRLSKWDQARLIGGAILKYGRTGL